MMKTLWQAIAPIVILFILSSCKNEDLNLVASKSYELGDTIRLYQGDSALIRSEGITICFKKVISDSRCPTGAMCIWAGEAVGELNFTRDSYSTVFNGINDHNYFVDGYVLKLVDILPYPIINPSMPPLYSAKIIVTRPLHSFLKGTAKDYTGLDGCGFVIELDNGTKLEPINCNFHFKNNQRIALAYTPLSGVATICMVGQTARIDEVYELVE